VGTGAYMTVTNSSTSSVTSSVQNPTCMYENGDDGSHLEYFNTSLASGDSLANVYIEANGDFWSDCSDTQSCFTLAFSDSSGNIGSVTINLGSGLFNTSVVGNTAFSQIVVSIAPSGDQFTIGVVVAEPTVAVQLVNSAIGANAAAIQSAMSWNGSVGGLTLNLSAFSGLEELVCALASMSGQIQTGIQLELTLAAQQLLSSGTISYDSETVNGGVTLYWPVFSASATIQQTESGASIQLTSFQLTSGTVDLEADGLDIPDPILSGLMGAVEALINSSAGQNVICGLINRYLS
jgi:hypothetical protein